MGNNPKKKKFTEKQMKDKIKSNIHDIKMQTMNQDKNNNEINIFTNDNFNITTEKKIPFYKDKNESNIKKRK